MFHVVAALALGLTVQAAEAPDSGTQTLPRYSWTLGQQARYEFEWEFVHSDGTHGQKGTWTLTVLAVDDSGAATIGVHRVFTPFQTRDEDRYQGAENALYDRMVVAADGTSTLERRVDSDLNPYHLFPKLPKSVEERKVGWFANYTSQDGTSHYRWLPEPGEGAAWAVEDTEQTVFGPVYDIETTRIFRFGSEHSFPREIAVRSRQGWGLVGQGEGTTKLISVEQVDPATLAADLDLYLTEVRAFNQFLRRASEDPEQTKTLLDEAAQRATAVAEKIQEPGLRQLIERRVQLVPQQRDYVRDTAQRRARIVGNPSPPWSTTDLEDRPHELAEYRGKVLVLDFWYRGSGWCIRNMPTLKAIASRYEGQPLQVIGLNSDGNVDDAKFVAEAVRLNYPVLKAGPAALAYEVRLYPTIIIVDHEGIVRELHIGFVPDLERELIEELEPLVKAARESK